MPGVWGSNESQAAKGRRESSRRGALGTPNTLTKGLGQKRDSRGTRLRGVRELVNATAAGAILVPHCRPRTLTSALAQGKCFCSRHHSAAQRSLIERTAGFTGAGLVAPGV